MDDLREFGQLSARLRAGDDDAAQVIFDRFAHRLIGLARTRLDEKLRQKVGPEDVMQSVLKSFFLRQAKGHFDLHSWDSLWSLLTVLTLRKCGFKVRHFRTAGRNYRREVAAANEDDSASSWEAIAREPTPDEAAMLTETVAELLRGLSNQEQQIVQLHLQGYNAAEIAQQAACGERTVYRLLERLRARMEQLETAAEAS